MKQHELNLDSNVFDRLRYRLSNEISETVREMMEKDLSEGTVTAKIKVGVIQAADENGEVHRTVVFEPKVTSKIGKTSEEKVGATGGRLTIAENGDLLIGNEQVSMDELMEKDAV